MIFLIGAMIFCVGCLLMKWNESRPFTWRDKWFPRICEIGAGLMFASIVIFLSKLLP